MLQTQTIRSKLIFVFCITLFSVCALTGLNLWSLSYVNKLMSLSESFGDLTNNILEVRRFEKNILLYYDMESLQEVMIYLERTSKLIDTLSEDIIRIIGMERYSEFRDNFNAYNKNVDRFTLGVVAKTEINHEQMRAQGKAMVDFANDLSAIKRNKIHRTIYRLSMLPFAFLCIFVLIMVLVITLVSNRLLHPLKAIQKKTKQVGSGDFTPISFKDSHNDEISGLIRAFNRMAAELETNQEDLLQARKMASLGTFTAGIAHELNNPINNISLTAESFLSEYSEKLDAEGAEMLQDIMLQVDRANDIVRNLLDFSRTQESAFSELNIENVIQSTIKLIKNQIKLSGIKLNMEISQGLPAIKGNMRSLQQVFLNLMINAHQAMPNGGSINIKASSETPDFVRVDIEDTGQGIPPDILEHIFDPFYTTKSTGKGVGLGLSVTYSLIKTHGGYIKVDSGIDQGTTFSVFLPAITKNGDQ
jgi:two-component system, NtrC family, sensor kinase